MRIGSGNGFNPSGSKNLSLYVGRFTLIPAAIWSKNVELKVSNLTRVDGVIDSWGVTVREVEPGESADLKGVTIADLLVQSGQNRISLLKIDIEGAETEVFSGDCDPWLSLVDNLSIELHGGEAPAIFYRAIANQNFKISRSGELTICRRS